jgi:lysophospholipase L1-like esterase
VSFTTTFGMVLAEVITARAGAAAPLKLSAGHATGEDAVADVDGSLAPRTKLTDCTGEKMADFGRATCSMLAALAILGACDRRSEPKPEEVPPAARSAPAKTTEPRAAEPAARPVEPAARPVVPSPAPTQAGLDEPADRLPLADTSSRGLGVAPEALKTVMPPGAKIYPKNIANKPVPRIGDQPWTINPDWRARHERQLRSTKRASAKVVFLGDSIVEGWGSAPSYREQFAKYTPVNLGIAGDYTQNVLWRIEHGALDGMQPAALVLLVGVNNLAGGFTPEQTAAGVSAVVASVQARLPSVPIVLLSILPARRGPSDPLRTKIVEVNRLLAKLSGPQVTVLDLGSSLLEPDGTISQLTSPDALHPSAAGYERLTAALSPVVEKLVPL